MPKIKVPEDLKCPITKEILVDPVSTADGHVYERHAIEKWFNNEGKKTSPLTGKTLPNQVLRPCHFAKKMVDNFLEQHKICPFEEFIKLLKEENIKKLNEINYLESYLEFKIALSEDTTKVSLIIAAAATNMPAMIEWLLEQGGNIEEKYINGSTALSFAAQHGAIDAIKFLLAKNAYIEAKTTTENENQGFTPLCWAIGGQQKEAVKLLLSYKANLNIKISMGGLTPLHLAACGKEEEIVKLLMQYGANPKEVNEQQQTAAEFAVAQNKPAMALLINEYSKTLKNEARYTAARLYELEKVVDKQQKIIGEQQKSIEQLALQVKQLTVQLEKTEPLLSQAALLANFSSLYASNPRQTAQESINVVAIDNKTPTAKKSNQ